MIARARRLRQDRSGSTMVEFALCASALFFALFFVIQGGQMLWTWQAMQGAAIDAARCAAIDAPSCLNIKTSNTATQTYAVGAAKARGVAGVTASANTLTVNATAGICGTTTGATFTAVYVKLTYTFGPVFMFNLSPALSAVACFPYLE
jgi:Flp pilus assembly protein TadG